MATAVQPPATTTPPDPRTRLLLASVFGAVIVLAGAAAAGYLLPRFWHDTVSPIIGRLGGFIDSALLLVAVAAVIVGFIGLGSKLAGTNPPKGVRGGIFLVISLVIAVLFIVRAVGLNFEGSAAGLPLTAVVLGACLVGSFFLLKSDGGQNFMVSFEEQGWLSTFSYKKTQGIRARRYTLLGFLLIGWTGVYSLMHSRFLADANAPLILDLPFTDWSLPLLSNVGYTLPAILAVATFWVAWRAVNLPTFADFLIATEAEMNKVSWSSRKRLAQDTVVVLVTVFLLTAFLFVVDWFWGTLLSTPPISVLPSGDPGKKDPQNTRVDW